ncbi:MAG: LysR family transcriptional regulator [Sphingomonadales bacterium]|nr:LysR family transcriptional regulator [Sphingomonadales bacterium]
MRREELADLSAFLEVAEQGSFTRAASRLGTSQSALSHTIRRLEARIGVRLLARTTRSVAPTEAGERLIAALRPALDEIAAGMASVTEMREKPSGTIRITAAEHAAQTVLWPALERIMPDYPDIRMEVSIDGGFTDIVANRFDAGIRLGESIARDMVAVRIGPDMRMAAVASPAYIARHGAPRTPHDLAAHDCINLRFLTHGNLYAWEFEKDGRELNVGVEGRLTLNNPALIVRAAKAGLGIGYLLEDYVLPALDSGELVRLLDDWCPPFAGYHLYYPNRRQHSAAFSVVLDALRSTG